jgi:DNA-binding transcriptional LysR family regulator
MDAQTDLNAFRDYALVVAHGGFSPAARALGIPKSRLSRRVAELEARLGLQLIQRSTRRFHVTETGRAFYQHCQALLGEAEAALGVIEQVQGTPRGRVRLSCPTALTYFLMGELIAAFMAEHPAVNVELESTNRRVDVIGEGLDLAIRVRFPPLEDSGLVMRVLADSAQRLVASPALLAAAGPRTHPGGLAGLPSLDWTGGSGRAPHWVLIGPDGDSHELAHQPRLQTEDMMALRCAALRGLGLVQLPALLIREELQSGRLVEALPGWRPRSGIVHAVFPSRRGLRPAVRALLDYLASACQRQAEALIP